MQAAEKYKNEFVPKKIYKFMDLPEDRVALRQRVDQIILGKIWMSKKVCLNDFLEFEMIDFSHFTPEEKLYYDESANELELACFTSNMDNQAMWGYYARGKYGLCIEYTVDDKKRIYPVEYIKSKVDYADMYKWFQYVKMELMRQNYSFPFVPDKNVEIKIKALQTMFCYKDKSWSHEKEIRIFSKKQDDELGNIIGKNSYDDINDLGSLHDLENLGIRISRIFYVEHQPNQAKALGEFICKEINRQRFNDFRCRTHEIEYSDLQKQIKLGFFSHQYEEVFCKEKNF